MAECHRQETVGHILRIIGVVAVRLELPQWALIRDEPGRIWFFLHHYGLLTVSGAFIGN